MAGQVQWQRVLGQMTQGLRGYGLDVLAPLSVDWYNAAVAPALQLPWLGRDRAPLAILIGNSKAIWEPFKSALHSQSSLLHQQDPLNAYVRQAVTTSLGAYQVVDTYTSRKSALTGNEGPRQIKAVVYWDHDTRPGKLVAMQRLASVAGLAYLHEEAHLSIHPIYGPWFALRAVVIFDLDPPAEHPEPLQNPLNAEDRERVKEAMNKALQPPILSQQICCGSRPDLAHWRRWLAVRDAIRPNHPMRYSPEQIEYHYTHNKDIISRALAVPELGDPKLPTKATKF